MGKKIDLTGQRFGRLVVVEESAKKNGKLMWNCLCDCGNTKVISGQSLRQKATRSCGCLLSETASELMKTDLTGRNFNRLYVVKESEEKPDKSGSLKWLCRCECGNFKVISGASLRKGLTKSCGCLSKEISSENGKKTIANLRKTFEEEMLKENTQLNKIKSVATKSNKSGVVGVCYNKNRMKWNAVLYLKNEVVFNEFYEKKQDAIQARKEAEEKYFKPILEKYSKEIKEN